MAWVDQTKGCNLEVMALIEEDRETVQTCHQVDTVKVLVQ